MLKAGFARVDITPTVPCHKLGWLADIVADRVADPLFANIGLIASDDATIGFVSLDHLSARWTTTARIRQAVAARCGLADGSLMVAATHNHAGPAVARTDEVPRDDGYLDWLVERVADGVAAALAALEPCRLGFGHEAVFGLSHNRRVVMRDGTVRCHGSFSDPAALCLEGPIDPELAVIGAVGADGRRLGALVNFACHATHHGPDGFITAGWPGAMVRAMAADGWPVGVFLNGAAGNLHHSNPCGPSLDMEPLGRALAERVEALADKLDWREEVRIGTRRTTIELPYRSLTDDELAGRVPGAQRFRPELYERVIPAVAERIRSRGRQPAEIQAHLLDEYALVSIPAEYFAELGLRIKEECHPRHALVVGFANGMVGYVPTREAFRRGGYETTFMATSRMAPEAGELLADAAIALVRDPVA